MCYFFLTLVQTTLDTVATQRQYPLYKVTNRHQLNIVDTFVGNRDGKCFLTQPSPTACLTWNLRHVSLNLVADIITVSLFIAPHQITDDTFEGCFIHPHSASI